LDLSRIAIFILVISSLSLVAFMDIVNAHNPSEELGNAHGHMHQLPPPWPYHLIFVSVGGVSLAGGFFTARYLKHKKEWLNLHKKFVLFGSALVLTGLSIAAYMVSTYMETYFVMEPHAYLGATTFVFILLTPTLGFAQFRLKDKRIRTFHKYSGRLTMMLILATIIAGIQMVLTM
jgi:hypothetical protein